MELPSIYALVQWSRISQTIRTCNRVLPPVLPAVLRAFLRALLPARNSKLSKVLIMGLRFVSGCPRDLMISSVIIICGSYPFRSHTEANSFEWRGTL